MDQSSCVHFLPVQSIQNIVLTAAIIITKKSQVSLCYGKFLIHPISIKYIVCKKYEVLHTMPGFFSLTLYTWSIWSGILIHLIWIKCIYFITRIKCLLHTIPIFSLIILFACSIWSGDPRITNTFSAGLGGGLRSNSQCAPVC